MRQVPASTMQKLLIIGSGRTAHHLTYYFKNLGFEILTWARKTHTEDQLISLFNDCHYCFVLIKDDALQDFFKTRPYLISSKCFHCSGALHIDGVNCIHPLMSFGTELYNLTIYRKIHWAVFTANKKLSDYIPGLENPYFYVNPQQKNLYHAYCVMAGNFMQILLLQVMQEWQKNLNLNTEALKPYLDVVYQNFWQEGAKAVTGPLVRKDFGTIKKHLENLNGSPLLNVYQAFLKLYLSTAELNSIEGE